MYSASSRSSPVRAAALALLAAVACLLATALLLSSCTRKSAGAPAPASAPAPAGAGAQASAPPAAPASPVAGGQPAEPLSGTKRREAASAPPPVKSLAATLRGFGLGVASAPRAPEDFSLGPLQSYAVSKGDEAAVLAAARKFMDGIAAGKLDESLLLPEARSALSALLAPEAQAAPTLPYRLGAISIRGDDASLLLRMPRPEGSTALVEGLLSLRKSGESWYVQALALKPPRSAALAFLPGEGETASAGRASKRGAGIDDGN